MEGEAGDNISFTQLDSFESGEFAAEFPVPMNTALCLGETRLATLGHEEGCEGFYMGNGAVNRMQDGPLDLSPACFIKAEPQVKEEHGRCCDSRQNSCEGNSCKPCLHAAHGRNERRPDVFAGHHRLCPHAGPALHKLPTCDIRAEGAAPACNRSPVKQERKMENGGQKQPKRESPKPDGTGKGSDICCFCLNRSQWIYPNGNGKNAAEAGAICMREPSPGSTMHHPSKRVTDPLLKEELESLEREKQQTKNPDGTSPVRLTGSSYAVLQQMPFRKGT